jgi:hypothetical protein
LQPATERSPEFLAKWKGGEMSAFEELMPLAYLRPRMMAPIEIPRITVWMGTIHIEDLYDEFLSPAIDVKDVDGRALSVLEHEHGEPGLPRSRNTEKRHLGLMERSIVSSTDGTLR